jgi:hypothetical protein
MKKACILLVLNTYHKVGLHIDAQVASSAKKEPRCPLNTRVDRSQSGSGRLGDGTDRLPLLAFEIWIVQPTALSLPATLLRLSINSKRPKLTFWNPDFNCSGITPKCQREARNKKSSETFYLGNYAQAELSWWKSTFMKILLSCEFRGQDVTCLGVIY